MISKSSLARTLSSLQGFANPRMELEQYTTPGEIAAAVLHHAAMQGDIVDKRIADLGCGTGIFGIGAGLLGAEHVTFLDIDSAALDTLRQNLSDTEFSHDIIHEPLRAVQADTVVMNPPFGTKRRHADKQFLLAAMRSAPVIYSMHMAGSEEFVDELAEEHGYVRSHAWPFTFPIPASMPKHTKKRAEVQVVAVRLQQQRL